MKTPIRRRRKNSKPLNGERLDTTMIFKYNSAKKNAIVRFARSQRRSYAYFFQVAADRIIAENHLQPIVDADMDLSHGLK